MLLNLQLLQWLVLGMIVWMAIITTLLVQTIIHYRRLTKNITKKDLKTALTEILNYHQTTAKQLKELDLLVQEITKNISTHIQKIGFIRFNPFPQTGGDQSFVLSLLDEKNNGFVLSSLHSRDTTRFYAKTVKDGKGDGYQLSKEEKRAIKSAK